MRYRQELSRPDEITNFDYPQHAVALQRFRILDVGRWQLMKYSDVAMDNTTYIDTEDLLN